MMQITYCKVNQFVKYCQVFGALKLMLLGKPNFHVCEIIMQNNKG